MKVLKANADTPAPRKRRRSSGTSSSSSSRVVIRLLRPSDHTAQTLLVTTLATTIVFEGSDGHAAETTGLVRPTVRPWCFSASKRAVASAAVSKRGASQPALGASTSLGASRTLEDAAVVQRAQEFRQAVSYTHLTQPTKRIV